MNRRMLLSVFLFLALCGFAQPETESVSPERSKRSAIVGMTMVEMRELVDALGSLLRNEERILSITFLNSSSATVRTGRIDNPLSGGGDI